MFGFRQRTRSARRLREPRYFRPRIEPLEERRLLSVYVVNETGDRADLILGDGKVDVDLNKNGDQVTLRGALMEALFSPTKNTIEFKIPGPGPHVIRPIAPLPEIIYPITIDGYSQPGAVPNSKTFRQGHDAVIKIELDGALLPMGADGLVLSGGQSEVSGLAIHSLRGKPIVSYETLGVLIDHEGGAAIRLTGAGQNIVAGNFLGATATASPRGNFGAGLHVASSNNVVGLNVISGNRQSGVLISNPLSEGNYVSGNLIGTHIEDDEDDGPNDLMNFPVGVTGWYDGTNTYISGVLSTADPDVTEVDIYANKAPSQVGFGPGEIYLGTVVPKASGAFHLTWPGQLPHPFLSSTSTRSVRPTALQRSTRSHSASTSPRRTRRSTTSGI